MQTAANFAERTNQFLDDVDVSDAVREIEQVLDNYRKELRQESYTQLDCSRKLITRLFDFIRPTYTTHKKKMTDLNALYTEISELQDLRFHQLKDKHEQLTSEIFHLRKKLLMTSANESYSSKNTSRKVFRIRKTTCDRKPLDFIHHHHHVDTMVNYEQWMAMEEDTRKLHALVELQRDRINELINLLSHEG